MLIEIREINPEVVDRLVDLYAESMDDLQAQFPSRERMLAEYASFLAEFVKPENQKIFVEEADDAWVSALRAIETEPGKWFFEAVETKPSARGCGYGSALVRHTLAYLAAQGMTETTCTIAAGKRTGRATITITLKSGLKKNITVTVQRAAVRTTKLSGIARTLNLKRRQTMTLKPVVTPLTSLQRVIYASSNRNVAVVNSRGKITAMRRGTAVITVRSGNRTVRCKVTVK